jgi:hypothetical protein
VKYDAALESRLTLLNVAAELIDARIADTRQKSFLHPDE